MFTRILVPTDFSEPSDAALDHARTLAEKFGATLHLINVVEPSYLTSMVNSDIYIGDTAGLYDMQVKESLAKLATRVLPADRISHQATSEVITGQSGPAIVDVASEIGANLIVMGTHGRTGLAHLVMGSVAEYVIRHAPCPVLTVRDSAAAAAVTASSAARTSRFDNVPGLG